MSAGSWTTAGPLPVPAQWQGAFDGGVLLADGRVLVTGGADSNWASVQACQIFDPETGNWTATAQPPTSRSIHSTTVLGDGTVLVAGGSTGPPRFPAPGLATAERFDPDTGNWSTTGSLKFARWNHSATLLEDGQVLVAGGQTERSPRNGTATASAELYHPGDGSWTSIEPMTDPRAGHQAVALHDGRVLVIGGTAEIGSGVYTGLGFCELYDPSTGKWTPTGSLAGPRWNHTATVLADGTVLVTGGGWSGMVGDWVFKKSGDWTAQRYDPAIGEWSMEENLSCARVWHQAVALKSGKVLVIGGGAAPSLGAGFPSTALYDPYERTWAPGPSLADGRWAHLAVGLGDSRVLVAGGIDTDQRDLVATSEIYTEGDR
ncbi:Kelch repeat-containing protein [Amycolatopsis sp. NPDC049868]|uniref:Kelch repeat-containing protein n=1 Tax=Amycolatopsis sp. NPDC049868 TaxID=3363934 RepID=UPI0037BBC6D1